MEDLIIRAMDKQDARAVLKGQRKAFSPLFGLFLSRPKEGVVAESGGRIVGAVTYKTIPAGKVRVGYLDIGYVDSGFRGLKLGGRLYEAAMDKLRDEGCEVITAAIRDDNRASWKIMERNGCTIHPFYRLIGKFGLAGALRIGSTAHFPYALGHELWATENAPRRPEQGPEQAPDPSRQSPLSALPGFAGINFLLLLLASRGNIYFTLGAMALLAAEILGGRIGTLGQPARWHLQRPHAGLALSVFVSITGGLLPSNAAWQLTEGSYGTAGRTRLLGRTSLFAWIAAWLVTAASFIALARGYLSGLPAEAASGSLNLGLMYLIYRSLAVFPFESFGGLRVYEWNRRIFWPAAAVSILTVILIFIFRP